MQKNTPYTYKITLAYDGSNYCGWQVQKNKTSIQEILQTAAAIFLKDPVQITGAGRTDAGVHARAQVAHFKSDQSLEQRSFLKSFNALIPQDIRIFKLEKTSDTFHARYSAIKKKYTYHFCFDKVAPPFERLYRYHIPYKIDVESIRKASQYFIGVHNFTSFANQAHEGSAAKNPVRELYQCELIEEKYGMRLELTGNGFLYKMVRNIVGTLLEVGFSKRSPESICEIFLKKNRSKAGKTAPPHGLFLDSIEYS